MVINGSIQTISNKAEYGYSSNRPASFFTSPTTLLTQAKSILTVVNPFAVESRPLRRRAGQRNDDLIDISMRQMPTKTALPGRGRWTELLISTLKTFLEIFWNPFLVPLCFVLALWYLISSFRASLTETVDAAQSAGTAIGHCFSFTWQYAGAWMQSIWNTASPPVYQLLSIGTDVTISATNETTVAICSHYFAWLILTNLGLDCPFSVPYQPLDGSVGSTLNNTTLGLAQIANTAVELLPYGHQLTWSELWLRDISFTILESDMINKIELAEFYADYTNYIAATGQELSAFASLTDSHLSFQKYNLKFLQVQIESDNERSWWLRLFFPKEAYIRSEYLEFIQAADDDLLLLLKEGNLCIELIRRCQETNDRVQQILQRNRHAISKQVDKRGILLRRLGRNEDLTRKTITIDNMEEYHGPVLDLLGSILDKVAQVRAELSTLSTALRRGHVGATSPQLMVQMQIISASMKRLQDARDYVREGRQKAEARHEQQFKGKMLLYRPLYQPQSHADKSGTPASYVSVLENLATGLGPTEASTVVEVHRRTD
ncbi:hypothetical protein EPUS_03579 [Endocarpon pusillum Z07020]|uniref:Uncharacterized protein n=1 Tax=Endocarpon pusillum (strain Z07020 / HMAS-L-300199) TaxID=1263415 RepID=U1FYN2_ENDPU|nr:uncharacterized protein EPUS_03579 [Endocarpon pusillum Z07020]ERF70027.1 hypothetical protein EPUS_03579 [Endocarpon pusillum Z07020]